MAEQSISKMVQERLDALEKATQAWQKSPNDIVRDAVIFRFQRAMSDILALMHASVSEEDECECESLEELLESVRESELIDEQEEEALINVINAVEEISQATSDETIKEIMQYMPVYHKALSIFAKKFVFEE